MHNVHPDPIDILIITALEHEAQAVISRLADHHIERFEDRNIRTYHCGIVPIDNSDRVYRVVVVLLPNMGELSAANATTDALSDWHPQYVLMIGIAGGIAQDDLDLGDVIVADQIVGYQYGKQCDDGLKPRDHVYPSSALLLERVRNFSLSGDEWSQNVDIPRPSGMRRDRAKRFVGPIASGNEIIASKEFQQQLLKRWPKLIAIETESEGVFSAVFDRPTIKHVLIIRGISDMADKAKNDVWQLYAANAAAAYAIAFLKYGPVDPVILEAYHPAPASVPVQISSAKTETLYTNLLHIKGFAPYVYLADTPCREPREVWEIFKTTGMTVGQEWILTNKRMLSFHDLDTPPFNMVCDIGTLERFDTVEWANSSDENKRHDFVQLLNHCLREKAWHLDLRFRSDKGFAYYYFRATKDLKPRRIEYASIKLRVKREVFKEYNKKSNKAERAYCRHSAFRGFFLHLNDAWYLEITPTYHFTRDGRNEDKFSSEHIKGIKRLERNPAVLGQLLMWADYLRKPVILPSSVFAIEYPFLQFGELATVTVNAGISDEVWYRAEEVGSERVLNAEENQLGLWGL